MDPGPTASQPQWSWPTDLPSSRRWRNPSLSPELSSDSAHSEYAESGTEEQAPPPAPEHGQGQGRERERRYPARTCRICLEVVHPTVEDTGGVFGGGRPRARYVSEDAELGRLMSPCKCKGSQRYVHEGCLQAWRQAAPLSDRNFWHCPTCGFTYRLERLRWGRWLSSRLLRVALTLVTLLFTVFLLGFVADPIIGIWLDPVGAITDSVVDVFDDLDATDDYPYDAEEPGDWLDHFLKGFFSLGLLGCVKAFFALSPWQWWNIRGSGLLGGGRRRGTGRDRLEDINLALVLIGVATFVGVSLLCLVGSFVGLAS